MMVIGTKSMLSSYYALLHRVPHQQHTSSEENMCWDRRLFPLVSCCEGNCSAAGPGCSCCCCFCRRRNRSAALQGKCCGVWSITTISTFSKTPLRRRSSMCALRYPPPALASVGTNLFPILLELPLKQNGSGSSSIRHDLSVSGTIKNPAALFFLRATLLWYGVHSCHGILWIRSLACNLKRGVDWPRNHPTFISSSFMVAQVILRPENCRSNYNIYANTEHSRLLHETMLAWLLGREFSQLNSVLSQCSCFSVFLSTQKFGALKALSFASCKFSVLQSQHKVKMCGGNSWGNPCRLL